MARIHIGTSGWHYPHWKGRFYPADSKPAMWLSCYAQQLHCVEINNSFYRLPDSRTFGRWATQTPDDFSFTVKAGQHITHRKKLRDCQDAVMQLLEQARGLGRKLQVILFQLPPHWHCNPRRLQTFLQSLPAGHRYAFEFRDPSWHQETVYRILREHNAAFCLFELGEHQTPWVVTADFVYIRLHGPAGPYTGSYTPARLRSWAEKLCRWQAQGKDCWIFFDNDEAGYAAKNALLLSKLIAAMPEQGTTKQGVY